jgi:23S rRNA (adenine2030-N6)-methyltransferase
MLSYQHIYHAGHMADVFKHTVLAALLARLAQKEAGFTYYDTHGGRGLYPVDAPEMHKTGEWRMGIARMWPRRGEAGVPAAVARYLEVIAHYNRSVGLVQVPGSPAVAQALLRPQDKIIAVEAHPQEVVSLMHVLQADARADLYEGDGHVVVPTLLPPPGGRGMVLIDPSFEEKDEYLTTVATVDDIYGIWSKGTVAVWYPLLEAGRHTAMLEGLAKLDIPATWVAEMEWPTEGERKGMYGCGLAILRLPFELEQELEPALTWLAEQFDGKATFRWLRPPV